MNYGIKTGTECNGSLTCKQNSKMESSRCCLLLDYKGKDVAQMKKALLCISYSY